MSSTQPPRPTPPGLGDLLSLLGSNNPFAVMSRSVEQFRTAVTGFIEVVQSFRETMDNLNAVARRMNRMLDDLEEPMRTVLPQITKSAEAASKMLATMREPVERAAPALVQLAETLNNPLVTDLPRRMTETMDVLSSLPRTLGPLGQMADLAGGFLGGRGLGSFTGSRTARPAAPAEVVETVAVEASAPRPARRATTHTAPSAQDTFRRSAAKHPAPKQPATKQATTKKATTKKATTKKATTRRTAAKKPAAKRTAAKKATPRKATKTASTRSTRSASRR
jgi:ABC-type transporter Mla subunit MlaD